jgi:hypothetical protein
MMLRACPREKEVSALVQRGQWPGACSNELREHVEGCRACGDLALVMQTFHTARAASTGTASPPSPGVLWWRAQLRRRKAAVEQISRPLFGAQVFALSITVAIAGVFAISQARHGIAWISWLGQHARSQTFHLDDLLTSLQAIPQSSLILFVFGLASVALLGGLVLYFDRPRQ